MATASQPSLHMSSADLIRKEALDYGGFGEVYLCYHVTLGQVVLKTMYTGPIRNEESKRSLLEEGNIMASLNHERVVKLLGVIMEDRDCSLVMELIPRGNLSAMLETVNVPTSIKGRIMVEILEGMVYLTERHVVHKDIKPGNILVDKDFHIKITDLGLATCQTWNRLTREESRRRSRVGHTSSSSSSSEVRCAGTLSYMAPEHLLSIHTPSTEKSDVYSFAIVVWVVLTGKEPYANARSEEQISQCVRNGDRPALSLIPEDTPLEMIQLMKRCWDANPVQRPTFKEGYDFFQPFYVRTLEPHVEEDLLVLRKLYEGPEELVEKMKTLTMNHDFLSADCPAPLVSSDPVEASIEDMHDVQFDPPMESLQADARTPEGGGGPPPPALEEKLSRELQYHKCGSYNSEQQQQEDSGCYRRTNSNPFLQNYVPASDPPIRQAEPDKPSYVSSVHSWTKGEPVQPSSQEEAWYRPTAGLYDSMNPTTPTQNTLPSSSSSPTLSQYNQQHPFSHYDRQLSCPAYPVSDTSAPDVCPRRLLAPAKNCTPQDPGSLYIHNASGIQIGHNNTMSISGYDSMNSLVSQPFTAPANSPIREKLQKYEDMAVTEQHLDLLRENIGNKWKRCARRLGLTSVQIETIEHDCFRDGLPEMVHQMLDSWKMKEGSIGCTIGKLCRALDGCVRVEVIQKILDTCGSS